MSQRVIAHSLLDKFLASNLNYFYVRIDQVRLGWGYAKKEIVADTHDLTPCKADSSASIGQWCEICSLKSR